MFFGLEKLSTAKSFDDVFSVSRLDRIPACDGHTDGRTDGHIATG